MQKCAEPCGLSPCDIKKDSFYCEICPERTWETEEEAERAYLLAEREGMKTG